MAFKRKVIGGFETLKQWCNDRFSLLGHSHSEQFDSRPDYAREIIMPVATANNNKATNIYQITGDGWLHWQGLVNTDQDILIMASPSFESLYQDLEPHRFDRFFLGGDCGDRNDQGAGMVYMSGSHTWFIYGQGNDRMNWRMSFIPSRGNKEASPVNIIPLGAVTTLRTFPAYGKMSNRIIGLDGHNIPFRRFWEIKQNNPTMPAGFTHEVTYPGPQNRSYMLTGYSTVTFTNTSGVVKRINRYWFCTGKAFANTFNVWNEWRIGTSDGSAKDPQQNQIGNDLILLENVDNKWRAVHVYNWIERGYANENGSYGFRGKWIVGSKVCLCEVRAPEVSDKGKWIRHSDSEMWRIDDAVAGTTRGIKITYTPFTFAGSVSTQRTMTAKAQVVTDNFTTSKYIYAYDSVNNPHPYTWEFPQRWAFQANQQTINGKVYRAYVWSYKRHFTAISPVVTWNQSYDPIRNPNTVTAPSEFPLHLDFSGNWTCYHNPSPQDYRNYLNDNASQCGFVLNPATGFRDHVTYPVDFEEEITTRHIGFTFGPHPTSAVILPDGEDGDTGGSTPEE